MAPLSLPSSGSQLFVATIVCFACPLAGIMAEDLASHHAPCKHHGTQHPYPSNQLVGAGNRNIGEPQQIKFPRSELNAKEQAHVSSALQYTTPKGDYAQSHGQ